MSYDKRKWVQITLPVKPEEHERIKAAAADQQRTMAVYLRMITLRAIARPAK